MNHTFPIKYSWGKLVWLSEFIILGRNKKLSQNWSGPYPIVKLFEFNVESKLPHRFIRVNVSRIKPYVHNSQNTQIICDNGSYYPLKTLNLFKFLKAALLNSMSIQLLPISPL